jgi:hypothetical protein
MSASSHCSAPAATLKISALSLRAAPIAALIPVTANWLA